MKEIYISYTAYNLWANRRMVEVFSDLSDNLLEAPIVSSFPSVRRTLLHIWDAETLWLERLQGHSPTVFPSKSFDGSNMEVFTNLIRVSERFNSFVASQPDGFFGETMSFTTLSYGPQTQRAFEMVHHCMNHSTMHRGQLITMGRQLGVDKFPPTDFAYFLREDGK
jgi:uncharacterized damage-inducible protein DinB